MSYFTYALKSQKDNSFYIGISKDPGKRLKEHNSGYSKYTKGHRPFEIIYQEEFKNRRLARFQEKYLKSGIGREYLKSLAFPCSSVGRARGC